MRTLLLLAAATATVVGAMLTPGRPLLDGAGPWVAATAPSTVDGLQVDGPLHTQVTFVGGQPQQVQVRVPDGTTVSDRGRPVPLTAGSTATFTGPDLELTELCRAGVCYRPPLRAPVWTRLAAAHGPVDTTVDLPVHAPAHRPGCSSDPTVCVDEHGRPLYVGHLPPSDARPRPLTP